VVPKGPQLFGRKKYLAFRDISNFCAQGHGSRQNLKLTASSVRTELEKNRIESADQQSAALRFCPDMIENLPVWGFRIRRLGQGARKHGIVSKPSDDAL
jgi:hypothetical protein